MLGLIAKPHLVHAGPSVVTDLIIKTPGVYNGAGQTVRSITVQADDVEVSGYRVKFTPDGDTKSYTPAVQAVGRSRVQFLKLHVTGGLATWGVSKTSDPSLPRPGNSVKGLPTGRGISLENCSDITVQGCEIASFFDGIVLSGGHDIHLLGNHIHNLRTTAIHGSPEGNVEVIGNRLHDMHPWLLGQADHCDFIHFWTKPGGLPVSGIVIRGNTLDQGQGLPIMGIYLDDNTNQLGFVNAIIANNTIRTNNGQGIRVENTTGEITGNKLTPTPGLKGQSDAPGIVPRNSTVTITGNTLRMNMAMKPYAAQNTALQP